MQYVLININNCKFLLPEPIGDYEFPSYILKHKQLIIDYIEVSNSMLKYGGEPFSEEMQQCDNRAKHIRYQLADFKAITGIVGFPFDMRDVDLYIINNSLNIASEFNI
ncbi:hypothetical protein [Photorhabdus luminescens]|uniref:Uncharacterized protein n=1 Tax=Photorhabdus luminescens subsp. mexicana TaxID=2100167 RepID=A0A4R4INC6_PHOLU|nr:hypothetical protein [Photorhabdus luminescens]TDB42073.1 hypothetical protein C5468_25335 [Photorhabdus luminescens subsp. mexicana]